MAKILIAEISGKRPGNKNKRPTEKFNTAYDKVIISNDSEGYETDWEIVNVPDDFRQWYIANHKNSERAWYAPMNRTYSIKYAREHNYDYLVQVDDNIVRLEIATLTNAGGIGKRVRIISNELFDDFVDMLASVLENTNAVMTGMDIVGCSVPSDIFLSERYCYSFFCLKLAECPDVFQGDFEDDIEYRLKCRQMGKPVVMIAPLRYGKTGQQRTKDLSGCRAAYLEAGIKRGENMSKIYNDVYSCTMRQRRPSVRSETYDKDAVNFKHFIKPFKTGVIVYDMSKINEKFQKILIKHNSFKPDKTVVKKRKVRKEYLKNLKIDDGKE